MAKWLVKLLCSHNSPLSLNMWASMLSGSLLTKVLLNTKQTHSAKKKINTSFVTYFVTCVLLVSTALKALIPGGGKETPTNIKGQPISVCPMWVRCSLGFISRICDIEKKKKRELFKPCAYFHWQWRRRLQQSWLTNEWVSFWHIQHVVISVKSTDRKDTQWNPLRFSNIFIIFIWAYLMRVISSIRPPFPLYKQEALIPNLLLATDSKSDKVPYTATTYEKDKYETK